MTILMQKQAVLVILSALRDTRLSHDWCLSIAFYWRLTTTKSNVLQFELATLCPLLLNQCLSEKQVLYIGTHTTLNKSIQFHWHDQLQLIAANLTIMVSVNRHLQSTPHLCPYIVLICTRRGVVLTTNMSLCR